MDAEIETGLGWLHGKLEDWLPFLDCEEGYRSLHSKPRKRRFIEQGVANKYKHLSEQEQAQIVEWIIDAQDGKERIAYELADYGDSREEILRRLKTDVLGRGMIQDYIQGLKRLTLALLEHRDIQAPEFTDDKETQTQDTNLVFQGSSRFSNYGFGIKVDRRNLFLEESNEIDYQALERKQIRNQYANQAETLPEVVRDQAMHDLDHKLLGLLQYEDN